MVSNLGRFKFCLYHHHPAFLRKHRVNKRAWGSYLLERRRFFHIIRHPKQKVVKLRRRTVRHNRFRLLYKHSGIESRSDQMYLQAENLHHAHTQIPFWLEIQVIPENDNPPRLAEPYRADPRKLTIHVKSERILYHSLFPWLDGDSYTSTSLDFFFPELFREFTICRRTSPEIPVRNFTSADLHSRALLIRHVSLKTEAIQQYFVSDGKHTIQSEVKFRAEPGKISSFHRSFTLA